MKDSKAVVAATAKPAAAKPAAAKPAATKPAASKPAAAKPAAAKPVAAKPAAAKPVAAKPAAAKPVASRAVASRPAVAKPESATPAVPAKVAVLVEDAGRGKKKAAGKKAKLVRDSFTMPEGEYQQIPLLKQRVLSLGQEVKKSELLRAGLAALTALSDAQLLQALSRLEKIKTGRPAK